MNTNQAFAIGDVVIDMAIYPRGDVSQPTVERYAEALRAGDQFPPIVLEEGTDRLLDGMHRYRAHLQLGLTEIRADHHTVPEDMPTMLYAASLSTRHGDRMNGKDLQAVVRKVVTDHPDYPMAQAAKVLGVTRQTVSKWASDITERRDAILGIRVLLLSRLDWKQTDIATELGISQATVSRIQNVKADILNIAEDLLREATVGLLVDVQSALEDIREERIFAAWSDDERDLLKRLRDGETIVINMRQGAHSNLMGWADSASLFARIDRRSDWGNPFELPDDGDRETVIANYAEHYLPYKPSLLSRLDELRGKALGCWCAPEPCHGDVLKAASER